MRPHTNGTTPGKKGAKGRGKKSYQGGVRSTLVKAKVTAVKTGRRLRNPRGKKDEIEDLLERTANDSNLNGSYVQPGTESGPSNLKVASVSRKMRKMRRSFVAATSNGTKHSKLEDASPRKRKENGQSSSVPAATTTRRLRSTALPTGSAVEVAEEAIETTSSNGGPGFLKKTISKIWKVPADLIAGNPYSGINERETAPTDTVNTKAVETEKPSCVIS